tara:strand:- start:3658 stop:4017 length:360 start_codon:yes stop_codon:yes gene_type:complete
MLLRLINKARFQDFLANAATLAIMIAIALGTLMPAPQLPELPGNDKAIHLLAFVMLTLPLSLRPWVNGWKLGLGCLAFGAAIEIIQPFVNRSGEWLDLGADAAGIVLGLAIGQILRKAS